MANEEKHKEEGTCLACSVPRFSSPRQSAARKWLQLPGKCHKWEQILSIPWGKAGSFWCSFKTNLLRITGSIYIKQGRTLSLTPQFKLGIALSPFSSSQANKWDGVQEIKPKNRISSFFPLFTFMCFHLLCCGDSLGITVFLKVTASALRNSGSLYTKVTVPRQVQNGKNN